MFVTFKIIFTKEYLLQIRIIDSSNEETIIKLSDDEYYNPTINFDDNFISINKQNNNSIHFIKQWFDNPFKYQTYNVEFQFKQYELLPEVLFALFINEFKQKVEKDYIIQNTFLESPFQNNLLLQRIKISLQAIHLKGITIEAETINYDYSQQGEYLHELLEKKQQFEEYQRMIQKAQQMNLTNEEKQKLQQIQKRIYSEESFYDEMIYNYSLSERNKLNLCKLDNYCIFIASRYFESLQDHINLVKVCKRLRGNMEKFHYNPITLDAKTIQWFPNVETYHVYDNENRYVKGGRIKYYINWCSAISYLLYEKLHKMKDKNNLIFKKVIWCKEDTKREYDKHWGKVEIPAIVNGYTEDCFDWDLKEITFLSPISENEKRCLEKCWQLESINLPLVENHFVWGNKIFYNKQQLKQIIYLPDSVQFINDEEIEPLKTFEIPTTVTSLDEDCFYGCDDLKHIIIPETVIDIPFNTFYRLPSLKRLTTPTHFEAFGNRVVYVNNNCLYSFELPSSIKKVNDEDIEDIDCYVLPTNVTKLSDYCFADCDWTGLIEIVGLENIKEMGKDCFFNSLMLIRPDNPHYEYHRPYTQYNIMSLYQKEKIEEWTGMKCGELLFDSNVDNWAQNTSVLGEKIFGKKQLVFLIENVVGETFGFYLHNECIQKYNTMVDIESKSFEFNIFSSYKRLNIPMKFEQIKSRIGKIWFPDKSDKQLIILGDICLNKQNEKEMSWCASQDVYDYHGIENAICGNIVFVPKHFVVIQMN